MCGNERCDEIYPKPARDAGIEGKVVTLVTIASDGNPIVGQLSESSGHELLDNFALKHIMRINYPVQVNAQTGEAFCYKVRVPIIFTLPQDPNKE